MTGQSLQEELVQLCLKEKVHPTDTRKWVSQKMKQHKITDATQEGIVMGAQRTLWKKGAWL